MGSVYINSTSEGMEKKIQVTIRKWHFTNNGSKCGIPLKEELVQKLWQLRAWEIERERERRSWLNSEGLKCLYLWYWCFFLKVRIHNTHTWIKETSQNITKSIKVTNINLSKTAKFAVCFEHGVSSGFLEEEHLLLFLVFNIILTHNYKYKIHVLITVNLLIFISHLQQLYLDRITSPSLSELEMKSLCLVKMWKMMSLNVTVLHGSSVFQDTLQ